MFSLILRHYILDAGINALMDNMIKNLRVAKPVVRVKRVVAPSEGDTIWIELTDGSQLVGEVMDVDAEGMWLEVLDPAIAETVVLFYRKDEIVDLDILDMGEDDGME